MSRHIVFFAVFSVISLPGLAQSPSDNSAEPAVNRASHHSQIDASARMATTAEARISVRRLKVPRKARELYGKALAAWAKLASSEAERRLDQALKLDPEFPEALTLRGGIQASNQRWESAKESLQAAIDSDPSYSPPYVILAGVYNTQDRFDEAQQVTAQAISAGAQSWSVQYEIVRSFIGKGEYARALAVADLSLQSEQHGSLMHLAKAHALLGLRRYVEAVAELRTFVHDQPSGDGSRDARDLLERLQTAVLRQPGDSHPSAGVAR
jgi:predicted Zn-dependent protease